jgi:hypothetical protein
VWRVECCWPGAAWPAARCRRCWPPLPLLLLPLPLLLPLLLLLLLPLLLLLLLLLDGSPRR